MFKWLKSAINGGFDKYASDTRKVEGCLPQNESQWREEDWASYAAPLVERWEGMARMIPGDKVVAYPDPGTGGRPWTIGVGSTTDELGQPIKKGAVWTIERARKRFIDHLHEFGADVDKLLGDAPTGVKQKAAMVSLAYNIGVTAFSKSTVLKRHKAGDYEGAATAFQWWVNANGKRLNGLVRRRKAEAELYMS